MAKRRHGAKDEILLVPFLDILCSLIGVLILFIVVLCVSQTQQVEGRTPEEVQMAEDARRMRKEIAERKEQAESLKEKIASLEKLQEQIEEKEQRFIKLRKLLDTSKEKQEENTKISQRMQKELDDLMLELEGMKKQQAESKKEIAVLMAELKKRDVPPEMRLPPVVVQPSGSGMAPDTKAYFVEASGSGLKILGAWPGEDYRLSATAAVVVADPVYNYFLTELAKDPKSLVLFLIRDDGQVAFNNGAGRAENDYKVRVGKLPIPGRGVLDLALFSKFRGTLPPPPAAAPTPAPTPPPAPPPPGTPPPKKAA